MDTIAVACIIAILGGVNSFLEFIALLAAIDIPIALVMFINSALFH